MRPIHFFLSVLCTLLSTFTSFDVYSQTIGEHHNAVMDRVVQSYSSSGTMDAASAIKIIQEYCSEKKLEGNTDFKAFETKYITGVKSKASFLQRIEERGEVSKQLLDVIRKVDTILQQNNPQTERDVQNVLSITRDTKQYSLLSASDKSNFETNFASTLISSFKYWSRNAADGTGKAATAQRKSRCTCGLPCIICVAHVDAAGASVGGLGGPAGAIGGAALLSSIARCCWCYTCCDGVGCN